jgi:hypothetical protein
MIEADLAKLVDQHDGALHTGRTQQVLEQRRLAAAEKPGENVDRDGGVGLSQGSLYRLQMRLTTENTQSTEKNKKRSGLGFPCSPCLRWFKI